MQKSPASLEIKIKPAKLYYREFLTLLNLKHSLPSINRNISCALSICHKFKLDFKKFK